MTLPFYKYQGTGNDFVMLDQRTTQWLTRADTAQIERLCNRRFGIGADGLILLQQHVGYDFEMIYFNADGHESSMCGNGGRCIVAFARHLGIIQDRAYFLAIDGPHEALIHPDGQVALKMTDVPAVETGADFYYLNTGSPHYVQFVPDVQQINVIHAGRAVRYSPRFAAAGVNVNFAMPINSGGLAVCTYERGVEDETLACGTGVTAAALAYYLQTQGQTPTTIPIQVKGGALEVRFEPKGKGFANIWLCGPAALIFEGTIQIEG